MSQIHAKSHAWLEKDKFTSDTINEQGNIHHIFPKAYLRRNGFKQSEYNQVVNYVWITQPRNLEIGDRAPKDYIADTETIKFHSAEIDTIGDVILIAQIKPLNKIFLVLELTPSSILVL